MFFNKLESYNSSPVYRTTVAFRNSREYEERLLEHYFFGLALHMWRIDGFTRGQELLELLGIRLSSFIDL
jgi:hypothetical protein